MSLNAVSVADQLSQLLSSNAIVIVHRQNSVEGEIIPVFILQVDRVPTVSKASDKAPVTKECSDLCQDLLVLLQLLTSACEVKDTPHMSRVEKDRGLKILFPYTKTIKSTLTLA